MYKEKKIYQVRRFKQFPKRTEKDVLIEEFENLKKAQHKAISLNSDTDSELYNTRYYVGEKLIAVEV